MATGLRQRGSGGAGGADPASEARRRILVVEDDALVRSALVVNLEDFGFEVDEAASAGAAIDIMGKIGASVDAAIIDMGLPDRKGDALVAELRQSYPDLPIVIASGYGTDSLQEQFCHDGRVAIVGKPYEISGLIGAVDVLSGARG